MDNDTSYESFLKYQEAGLKASNIPKKLWKKLYEKVVDQVFDAGNDFALIEVDQSHQGIPKRNKYRVVVTNPDGIDHQSEDSIWLVDHCWTWRDRDCKDPSVSARKQLEMVDGLKERMIGMMDLDESSLQRIIEDSSIDVILDEVWKYNQTYSFPSETNPGQFENLWYCLDEFGTRIRHHGDPNFICVPLFITFYGYSISVLFPKRSASYCDEITRDYCNGIKDLDQRRVLMYPWAPSKIDVPPNAPLKMIKFFENVSDQLDAKSPSLDSDLIPFITPPSGNISVYSKCKFIKRFLTSEKYNFVKEKSEADIVWLNEPVGNFENFFNEGLHQIVNSYPFEYLFTVTAYLSELTKYERESENNQNPSWFTTTYDMLTEFDSFVSYYLQTGENASGSVWSLISPSCGVIHTNCLNEIIRMNETRQPILIRKVHKYIINEKNIRFRLLFTIKSIKPLIAHSIDIVQVRMRNEEKLGKQEEPTHISVGSKFEDFSIFENSQSEVRTLKQDAVNILKTVVSMMGSKERQPTMKMLHYPQSRGVYYADFEIRKNPNDDAVEPVLTDIGSNVDFESFEASIPNFTNSLFDFLFCDDEASLPLIKL